MFLSEIYGRRQFSPWFAVMLAAIWTLLVIFFLGVHYDTNDDAMMMLMASGAMSGASNPYLIYSHYYWGELLAFCFASFPFFNAYTFFLLVAQTGAFAIFLHFVFTKSKENERLLLFLLWLFVSAWCIVKLQFTSVSICLGLAALVWWRFSVTKRSWFFCLVIYFCLMLCLLIRWESFVLIVGLSVFYIADYLWKTKDKVSFFFVIFVIVSALGLRQKQIVSYRAIDNYGLMTPDSEGDLRKIIDFPNKITDESLQKIGWQAIDYQLFKSWFWAESSVFNKRQFGLLAHESSFDFSVINIVKHFGGQLYHHFGWFLVVLCCFWPMKNQLFTRERLSFLIPLLLFFIVWIILQRALPRVYIPTIFGVLVLCLDDGVGNEINRKVLIFSFLCLILQLAYAKMQEVNTQREYLAFAKIVQNNPNILIVGKGSAIPIEGISPWLTPKKDSVKLYFNELLGTPTNRNIMDKWHFQNLLSEVWQRNDILIYADDVADIQAFITLHYGVNTTMTIVEKLDYEPFWAKANKYALYKINLK